MTSVIRVLEVLDQVRLRGVLESRYGLRSPARVAVEIARDFTDNALERGHGHQEVRGGLQLIHFAHRLLDCLGARWLQVRRRFRAHVARVRHECWLSLAAGSVEHI